MRQVTLCYLVTDSQVLLGMKKRGFGVGKWNGFGGKLGEGETLETALVREIEEETKVKALAQDLEEAGDIKFYFPEKPEWDQQVHIFLLKNWEGEPRESEEMLPKWFDLQALPFDEMWVSDKYWLVDVLAGEKIQGEVHFGEDGQKILHWHIEKI